MTKINETILPFKPTKNYKHGYMCYSLRLARYLLSQGCQMRTITTNDKYEGYLVFIFHDDKRLQTALNRWEYHHNVMLNKTKGVN